MRILILDDEIVSRTKLTLIMEHFGECDAVDNGQDAIALFREAHQKEAPYELIMLDINLPEKNGIEVLSEIREAEGSLEIGKKCAAKILMVTSSRNKERIMASIQSGCNDYIVKPFDIDIIRKKLAKYNIHEPGDRSIRKGSQASPPTAADQFISGIASVFEKKNINLPTLPKIRAKCRQMITQGADPRQLAALLKKDVAISVELIRSSDSVCDKNFFANKSLEQAITHLGISATQKLVDELSDREYFAMQHKKYRTLIEQLWQHSIASAHAAEITSDALHLKLKADPFFMGLLHDIGKLVLLQIIADMEHKGKLNGDISSEKLVNTINQHHGQFGARLLKKWKYAAGYIHGAQYHEDLNAAEPGEPDEEKMPPRELLIIDFANNVAKSIGFDLNGNRDRYPDLEHSESAGLLNLTAEQIDKTRQTVIEEMQGALELF